MRERPILFAAPMREEWPGEEWRPLAGFEGRYDISDHGRVWSRRGSFLRPWKTSRGYLCVSLRLVDGRQTISLHRAVMAAFVGPCPDGMEVAHGNGDRTDNRITNLRYAPPRENIRDREAHGRTARGSRNGSAALDEAAARTIYKLRSAGLSAEEIAHLACVSGDAVGSIWRGESWRHVTVEYDDA